MEDVFYIPDLEINLISVKKLYKSGLTKVFDNENIYIKQKEKIIIKAK